MPGGIKTVAGVVVAVVICPNVHVQWPRRPNSLGEALIAARPGCVPKRDRRVVDRDLDVERLVVVTGAPDGVRLAIDIYLRVAAPRKRHDAGLIPRGSSFVPRLRRELDVVVGTRSLVERRTDDQRRREAAHGANVRRVAKGDRSVGQDVASVATGVIDPL